MAVDPLLENDAFVIQLRFALSEGAAGLADVPMLLKRVLQEGRWKSRKIKTGEMVGFDRFEQFVQAKPLEGLGADMTLLQRICADDKETLDLIDQATQNPHGKHQDDVNNVNVTTARPQGNSPSAALRRLRKESTDSPEAKAAYASVLAGKISPHKAMLDLGYRQPTINIPRDDPARAARTTLRHMTPDNVRVYARLLLEGVDEAERLSTTVPDNIRESSQ